VLDLTMAAEGAAAMAMTVGEIVEDTEVAAIKTSRTFEGYRQRARTLARAGSDIGPLVGAMNMLLRRSPRSN